VTTGIGTVDAAITVNTVTQVDQLAGRDGLA
jgi:hypothetical protein